MNERSAIASQFIFWVGMLVFGLALVSFFISSEWIVKTYFETLAEVGSNDSDAANFFQKLVFMLLKFAAWLKQLPMGAKVAGLVIGGLIALAGRLSQQENNEED
ncbi:MAG: hypothetical protein RJA57_1349 [Bacteroidota bacterium]|jgi:hypothetical protein